MTVYKNLIFDYDGTVADSYPLFNESFQHALALHGIEADPAQTMRELKISVGYAARQYGDRVDPKQLNREMYDHYYRIVLDRCSLCPGMRELLEAAAARGVRCYIYTHSGKEVEDYLAKLGIRAYFADLMTASENFPRKPDPTALLALCTRNGLDLAESLMVGDRDIDIAVGHNAGMAGCLYDPDNFYDSAAVGAEHNVTSLEQVIALI